jgi:YebC/PmpR family DNA-binding regulatory protein
MAGHSQFSNIKHRKGAQDEKRAKVFTKLTREIIISAKTGGADPAGNSRLRTAISAARAKNLPKDRIESAINRGSSTNDADNYDEMRYEGYGPGGIAIIVEALTDNRNRTASDVRSSFTKNGGTMGEANSVSFMFDKLGKIVYPANIATEEEIFEAVIEAEANDCKIENDKYYIITDPELLSTARDHLTEKYGEAEECKLFWQPQNITIIDDLEKAEKLQKLIDILEDNDDVQHVYGNYQFSEDIKKDIL